MDESYLDEGCHRLTEWTLAGGEDAKYAAARKHVHNVRRMCICGAISYRPSPNGEWTGCVVANALRTFEPVESKRKCAGRCNTGCCLSGGVLVALIQQLSAVGVFLKTQIFGLGFAITFVGGGYFSSLNEGQQPSTHGSVCTTQTVQGELTIQQTFASCNVYVI